MQKPQAFVTVGTTSFDELVRCVDTPAFAAAMARLGFGKVVVQIGRGAYEPRFEHDAHGVQFSYFRLQSSIEHIIHDSELVIGHAGAGTALETMRSGKPLIMVINRALMGNHQVELADALHEQRHAIKASPETLVDVLKPAALAALRPFPSANASRLRAEVQRLLPRPTGWPR